MKYRVKLVDTWDRAGNPLPKSKIEEEINSYIRQIIDGGWAGEVDISQNRRLIILKFSGKNL